MIESLELNLICIQLEFLSNISINVKGQRLKRNNILFFIAGVDYMHPDLKYNYVSIIQNIVILLLILVLIASLLTEC